ncbi:hypothetical protein B0H14DRAFT_2631073 [Mycena olivaceomarginata]|nr:hypothetical protein B0H14DRAFT_2631073 [Mycena olivaceomarginata]
MFLSHHAEALGSAGRGRGRGISRPSANRAVTNNRTSLDRAAVALDVVKIMYWNIYHGFTLKLTDSEFHDVLSEYDIMLPRKPRMNNSRRGGGIALIIRKGTR